MENKKCSQCNEYKPFNEFYTDRRHLDGLFSSCKKCELTKRKVYQKKYTESIRNRKRCHYIKHKDKHALKNKEYYIQNKQAILKQHYEYVKGKICKDEKFKISRNISSAIYRSLKQRKNSNHWELLVGYTLTELFNRLQETMPIGYGWGDYLSGILQIDHIVPLKKFNYKSHNEDSFKKAWCLNNLQLLTTTENKKKGAK